MSDKPMGNLNLLATASLQPNDYNPNEMGDEAFAEFVAEVRHLGGLPKPIVVRLDGDGYVIVDGEHGWRAAQEVGFDKVPCEIISADDFEAMRQSYKRNQHGAHNPVLLGRMFRRMIDARGLSKRALADEIEVSEGTVRNALLYADASEMRNGYAFEKLGVKQVRIYVGLPRLAGDLWLDCGADPAIFGKPKYASPWGFPASTEQILCEEDCEPFLPLLQDLCYVHSGEGFSTAVERMLAFQRALVLVNKTKPLPRDDALPYLKMLAKVRWHGKDPEYMKGMAQNVLGAVFRAVNGEIKPAVPIDVFETWTVGPGSDEWSDLDEFLYGLGLLVGKHTDLDTMTQNVREELMARELRSAPDYIRDAADVPIRDRFVLMSLTAEVPEEIVQEAKRAAIEHLVANNTNQQLIEKLMAEGDMEGAVKLEIFGQHLTAESAFERSLSLLLFKREIQERNEFWSDRDKVTDAVVKLATKFYVIREGTVDGKPAAEVLRERLNAVPTPEFILLASFFSEKLYPKEYYGASGWLSAVEGKEPLDPAAKPAEATS